MAPPKRARTRRAVLRAVGVAGVAGLAGCSSAIGGSGNGSTETGNGSTETGNGSSTEGASSTGSGSGGGSGPVSILSAGSLENAFQNGLDAAVDVPLRVESHGSSTVAQLIASGQRDPDIVSLADTALFDGPLHPSWYAVFASNAVVIAYNEDTDAGERLGKAGAKRWYEVLLDDDVRLGRTDPTQDPLGYRTLFTLELASRYYDDASNLRRKLLSKDQIYPETGLISQFESGNIDAAIAYRNQAVERDYDYIDLPDRIDLSDPKYVQNWYSTVSYTAPSGKKTRGGLISYGSTIRHLNPTTRSVFEAEVTGSYLKKHGFKIPAGYPEYHGNPPSGIGT